MSTRGGLGIVVGLVVSVCPLLARDWPGFRGEGNSVSQAKGLPLHWSASSNVAWRVKLPGTGQSSPIIWRDHVYVTSAVGPRKEQLILQALAVSDGREVWRFTTNSSHAEEVSNMHSQAAPTPVASENGVFAFFESGDCLAVSHEGILQWHRALAQSVGEDRGNHGLGGSPLLFERGLVVPFDQQGPACLLALDRTTGATLWKTDRPDRVGWSTPIAVLRGDEWQIIVSAGGTVAGYEVETGKQRWEVEGILKNTVPSPTAAESILVIGSGSKGSNLALNLVPGTNAPTPLWRSTLATCGFASPLIHHGRAYFLSKAGVLTCVDARTGRLLFDERVNDGGWASPIGAGERIYVFGEKTTTTVLAALDRFQPLATNELKFSKTVCGVAATDRALLFRAYEELVCIRNSRLTEAPK